MARGSVSALPLRARSFFAEEPYRNTAKYCHTLQCIAALMARGSVGALPPRARSFFAENPFCEK